VFIGSFQKEKKLMRNVLFSVSLSDCILPHFAFPNDKNIPDSQYLQEENSR
jgi:hypothetical protein